MLFSFGVDAVEDFKEYMLRDYYCWIKTYWCWYKLKLLDNAANLLIALRLDSAYTLSSQTKFSLSGFGFYPRLQTPYISFRVKDPQKSKDPQVPVAPTTAEQRLVRKNKLKACGTLLMALPDKHQLKFNIHKDAKTLMEAIEKMFGGNKETKKVQKTPLKQQYENFTGSSSESLDQIHDRIQKRISQLEILGEYLSQKDINLKFLRFDMSKVECYNCYRKGHFARECSSPKDTRRNGAAEPLRRNVLVETSTSNALVSQCDGVGSYDWSFQAEEEPTNYALMAFTSLSSSSNNEVVSCSKACTKAYATLQSYYDKLTDDYRKSQFDVISYKTRLESVEARLLVYQQNESVFEEDIRLLKLEVQLRDNALVVLRQNLEKAEQERDDLKLKLEKFQPSSNNLSDLLASQTNAKIGTFMPPKPDLVFHNAPNDVELSPTKPDNHVETSISTANPKTTFPKPTRNGNCRNRKACFMCQSLDHLIKDCDYHEKKMAQTPLRNHAPRGHNKQYARMPLLYPQRHVVPTAVVPKSKLVPINAARPIIAAVLKPHVTRLRPTKPIVTKPHSPPRRHINRSPSLKVSNFPPQVTVVQGNPQHALKDKRVINSGCSRHVTGNLSYLFDFEELNGRTPSIGFMRPFGCPVTIFNTLDSLDFNDVYFVKELKFNLFSVSQMCDKKNSVLFTDTECLVLSLEFKLPDENQVLLRVSRENNMYNVNLKNIVPSRDLTCLFAKATLDESNLWHRRLGHINFKILNKMVKGNLVRGLPTKVFKNDHTCVACKKRKQHRASCKTKPVSSVNQPLQRLHMDLFGHTFVKSLNKKSYYLVVTDNYSRFTWVFFLATKDETSSILKTFITGIENKLSLKVKIIRSDNGTEFKNNDLNQFCGMKGIKREFSVPRTPQQNGIAERKNRTLIEAARTMLAYSFLPIPFWAEAVNISCSGPTWLFNIDTLTKTMNYQPVNVANQSNPSAGVQKQFDAEKAMEENVQQYVLFPVWSSGSTNPHNTDGDPAFDEKEPEFEGRKPKSKVNVSLNNSAQSKKHDNKTKREAKGKSPVDSYCWANSTNSTNTFSAVGPSNTDVSPTHGKSSYVDSYQLLDDLNMSELENITYSNNEDDVGAEADFNNLETSITVSPIPITRVYKDHPVTQIIGDLSSATQTRSMIRVAQDQEPKRVHQALKDTSWIEAMQEELLRFKMQKVWVLVDLPHGKRAIGFEDPDYPDKVYKVVKALYGLHQAPRACQDKYVDEILRKFGLTDRKSASTLIDTEKPLLKDPDVKRIFRYLKDKPHLGLWYPKDSPFNLVAYSDSDYASVSLDRKSTTEGCQFLGYILISWQCKKQTVVATSSTEAEYVAAASCYAQVLWIQNQLLDY
nr:putative ribonuclease H-like domain-containing protein [Tanacetum cinerariifolium]